MKNEYEPDTSLMTSHTIAAVALMALLLMSFTGPHLWWKTPADVVSSVLGYVTGWSVMAAASGMQTLVASIEAERRRRRLLRLQAIMADDFREMMNRQSFTAEILRDKSMENA